jgi:hypothetical protein
VLIVGPDLQLLGLLLKTATSTEFQTTLLLPGSKQKMALFMDPMKCKSEIIQLILSLKPSGLHLGSGCFR